MVLKGEIKRYTEDLIQKNLNAILNVGILTSLLYTHRWNSVTISLLYEIRTNQ